MEIICATKYGIPLGPSPLNGVIWNAICDSTIMIKREITKLWKWKHDNTVMKTRNYDNINATIRHNDDNAINCRVFITLSCLPYRSIVFSIFYRCTVALTLSYCRVMIIVLSCYCYCTLAFRYPRALKIDKMSNSGSHYEG